MFTIRLTLRGVSSKVTAGAISRSIVVVLILVLKLSSNDTFSPSTESDLPEEDIEAGRGRGPFR